MASRASTPPRTTRRPAARWNAFTKPSSATSPSRGQLPHWQSSNSSSTPSRAYYNQHRPHRALNGATPLHVFSGKLKAHPTTAQPPTHFRVRHDRVDKAGRITLRYLSRLHHIGLGAAYKGLPVHVLVANKNVRVIREDGSLIRELELDPSRDYQPQNPARIGHHVLRQVGTMT